MIPIDGIGPVVAPSCENHATLLRLFIEILQLPRGPIGVLFKFPLVTPDFYGSRRTYSLTTPAPNTTGIFRNYPTPIREIEGGVKSALLDTGLADNAFVVIPFNFKVRKHKNRVVKHLYLHKKQGQRHAAKSKAA